VIEYVVRHSTIRRALLKGCAMPDIFHHCSEILRLCMRYPLLTGALIEDGIVADLLDLAHHESFDISCEAFFSLRELLLRHNDVASAYIEANFEEFFKDYHQLLRAENYVTQRISLKLLVDVLFDRHYLGIMFQYVNRVDFLQIHMNLLRHSSVVIRQDGFHLFKIFVVNPRKPRAASAILARNCERQVSLLSTFEANGDQTLHQDLYAVMGMLQSIKVSVSPRSHLRQSVQLE